MARYFTLVKDDYRTHKNKVDEEWNKLIHAHDRRILNSFEDKQNFKTMIILEYQEILDRNARCKKRELNMWTPNKETQDLINLPGQGTIVIYKEQEVTNG